MSSRGPLSILARVLARAPAVLSSFVAAICLLIGMGLAVAAPPRDDHKSDLSSNLNFNLTTHDANLKAGLAAAARADWNTAIDRLHAAVVSRPTDARARRELGNVYLRAARAGDDPAKRRVLLAMADLEFDQAVRLDPRDAEAKRAWAETCVLNGNPDRAARIYEDLLAARGRGRDVDASQLFSLYLALGKPERGLYVFTEKLREQPGWQELRFLLAMLYEKAGNPAQARLLLGQVADAGDTSARLRELARAALPRRSP